MIAMRVCASCGKKIAKYNRSGFCSDRPCRLAAAKMGRIRKAEARERQAAEEIENVQHQQAYYLRRVRRPARPLARKGKQGDGG